MRSFTIVLLLLASSCSGGTDSPVVVTTVADLPPFLGGRFNGVFIDTNSDIAYLAQGEGGLGIYDLSAPSQPLPIGIYNTDGNAQDVQVRGNYAYIADKFSGLKIIDVSSPAKPVLVGSVDTSGVATKLALTGDYVYLADKGRGLLVIDVSDPANPVVQRTYDTTGRALGVVISADGNTAYVADRSALLVFDISNKNVTPVLLHSVDANSIAAKLDAYSVAVYGNVAYLADGESGLLVFDISNPSVAPVLLDTIDTPGVAKEVIIDSEILLLADGKSGLAYYDISTPAKPLFISQINTVGDSADLAVLGDDVLVADGYGGLQVVDISTPASPSLKGYVVTIGAGRGLVIDAPGETAYVADYYNGLVVVDISDPSDPGVKGHFPVDGDGYWRGCFDLVVDGQYAYIANGFHGLRIIDISDSNQLRQVSLTPLTKRSSWAARGIDKQGRYVYLAADDGGVVVVDVLNPENPSVVGGNRFEMGGAPNAQAKDVIVYKDFAILANGFASFAVSDISNPVNPLNTATILRDEFVTKGDGHGIEVWGDYAFLGHFGGGLVVIDISTPSSPVIMNNVYGGLGTISNLFVHGDYLYASDSADQSTANYHSLLIWKLVDPKSLPEPADGTYVLGGRYPAMDILGNNMFLAGEGFKVLDISNRLNPRE